VSSVSEPIGDFLLHDLSIRTTVARCSTIIGGLLVLYALVPLRGRFWWVGAITGLAALIALIPVMLHRLRRILAADRPVLVAVEALVLLLGMLVTGFAAVYFSIDDTQSQFSNLHTRIDALYFTVTTLSTVGFGDIAATGQKARLLVTVQMVFDLAFLGLAVRLLTGAARRRAGDSSHLVGK
jgi:hypothetical protein